MSDESNQSSEQAQTVALTEMPWSTTAFIRGNLAVGHLRDNLPLRLKGENGMVHVETLAAAIGVIAGFSAQNAALVRAAKMTSSEGVVSPFSSLVHRFHETNHLRGIHGAGPVLYSDV